MKTFARFLVIGTLAAALSGCSLGEAPDVGQVTQAMQKVDANALPADLMSCDAFYGEDWDTPDAIVGVKGNPDVVVLMQAGEMVCAGQVEQLTERLGELELGVLMPLNGDDDSLGVGNITHGDGSAESPVDDSNPLPARPLDGESAESPVDDSNPLPARPTDGDNAAAPVDDSNPLPATPAGGGSAESPVDDSNPLPARGTTATANVPHELTDPLE